jgi:hypothetical protein
MLGLFQPIGINHLESEVAFHEGFLRRSLRAFRLFVQKHS